MICKNCGQEVNPADGFCRNCGEKIKVVIHHPCTFCGTLNSKSAKFCKFCGRKLDLSKVILSEPTAVEKKTEPKAEVKAPVTATPKKQEVKKPEVVVKPQPKVEPVVVAKPQPAPKVEPQKEVKTTPPAKVEKVKEAVVLADEQPKVVEKAVEPVKVEHVQEVIQEPVQEVKDEPVVFVPAPVVEETIVVAEAEPAMEEPIIEEPVVAEPIVAEPIIAEPVVAEAIIEEPVVVEPAYISAPDTKAIESAPIMRSKDDRRVDRLRVTSKIVAGILMLVSVAMLLLSGLSATPTELTYGNFFDLINPTYMLELLDQIEATGLETPPMALMVDLCREFLVFVTAVGAAITLGVMLLIGIIKFALLKRNRYSYVGGIAMKMYAVSLSALAVIGSIYFYYFNAVETITYGYNYITLGLIGVGLVLLLVYLGLRTRIRSREKLGGKGAALNLTLYIALFGVLAAVAFMYLGAFHFDSVLSIFGVPIEFTYHGGYWSMTDFVNSTLNTDSYEAFLAFTFLGEANIFISMLFLIFVMSSICSMISKGRSCMVAMVFSIFFTLASLSYAIITYLACVAFVDISAYPIALENITINGVYVVLASVLVMLLSIFSVVLNSGIKRDRMRKVAHLK